MGFCSTLIYYRPQSPPLITARSCAAFIRQFLDLGLSDERRNRGTLELKFGSAIDHDDKPSWWITPTAAEAIGTVEEIDWDIERFDTPLEESLRLLEDSTRTIYRGHIAMGAAAEQRVESLRRIGSPENDVDFVPDSWSMQIGPIETGRDGEFMVGWLGIGLSGNGYLFPWTLPELIHRSEQVSQIQDLMKLCRETWPMEQRPVDEIVQSKRKQMGSYWPYDQLDLPWDWYWGLQGIL